MSRLDALLQDYQRLIGEIATLDFGWRPADLVAVRVEHQCRDVDKATLPQVYGELAQSRGWLLLPGRVVTLPAPPDDLDQPPLQGEACLNGEHLRLSYRGGEQWKLHRFRIAPCSAQEATHLAQSVVHRPDPRAPGPLRYQRLWQIGDDGQLSVSLALFDGFEETQG